jgi:DnaJ-class molecular chaperone
MKFLIFLVPLLHQVFKKNQNRAQQSTEIKSAYKTIAREYHPDKNEDPEAVEIFQEAAYAKEILTDEHLRERYDSCGHPCLEGTFL